MLTCTRINKIQSMLTFHFLQATLIPDQKTTQKKK